MEKKRTKISHIEFLKELRGKCHGKCIGEGKGLAWTDMACPEPCDPEILKSVRDKAKSEAWTNATKQCGEHCMCVGEAVAWVPEQCVPIKLGDGRDGCLYFADYVYVGKCTDYI